MADDLHARLLAAISAREERARNATKGPWRSGDWTAEWGTEEARITAIEHAPRYGAFPAVRRRGEETLLALIVEDAWGTDIFKANIAHILGEDPSAVLRQTTRDRRVLKRHAICRGERDSTHLDEPWCHACNLRQPCPEIVDAAVANDVDQLGASPG